MAARRYSAICRAVPSAAFSAILPEKPSVTTTSTVPLADIVALDEAEIVDAVEVGLAEQPAGFLDLFLALDLLDADIEQADRRALDLEQRARHGAAHQGEIHQLLRVGADRRADIEHDALALQRRPDRRDRRALDIGHGAQAELRHRHQRAGIAGRDDHIGVARA